MKKENEEFFETVEVEELESIPEETETKIVEEVEEVKEDFVFDIGDLPDTQPTYVAFHDDEPVEIKKFETDEGSKSVKYSKNAFKIVSAKILPPRIKDVDGKIVAPIEKLNSRTNKKSKYYETKLELLFEDSDYKALVTSIRWFVNGNQLRPNFLTKFDEKINDMKYVSEITKLYWKFCDTFGYDKSQKDVKRILSQKEFVDSLKGKSVILREATGIYEGRQWHKLIVDSFVIDKK